MAVDNLPEIEPGDDFPAVSALAGPPLVPGDDYPLERHRVYHMAFSSAHWWNIKAEPEITREMREAIKAACVAALEVKGRDGDGNATAETMIVPAHKAVLSFTVSLEERALIRTAASRLGIYKELGIKDPTAV